MLPITPSYVKYVYLYIVVFTVQKEILSNETMVTFYQRHYEALDDR